jgi:hypothetical protein
MPPRSRLFCLEPVGVGTAAVESLTGYVARLAAWHAVWPRDLVVEEILPLLGRPHLAETRDPALLSAFWRNETRALNGTRLLARHLVDALATLTGRTDLRFLTLLTWSEILPLQQLQRPTRAWCPACFAQWLQAGQTVYEPLLWSLVPLIACPGHGQRLRTVCPYPDCRRPSSWLAAHSRPGYCPFCKRWLGCDEGRDREADAALGGEELATQTWIADVLGEILAAAPALGAPVHRAQLSEVLATIPKAPGKRQIGWARTVGVTASALTEWRAKKTIPSLWFLLLVCRRLGTTPLRLLRGDLGNVPTATTPDRSVAWFPRRMVRPRTPLECVAAQRGLEETLKSAEQPPLSLRQAAQRLGYTQWILRRHLPELCQAISDRYLNQQKEQGARAREERCAAVRTAIYQIHAQGRYPSTHQVSLLLGRPHVVRSKSAKAVWRETLRELGWSR